MLDSSPSQPPLDRRDSTSHAALIESDLSLVTLKKKGAKYRAQPVDDDAVQRCSFSLEGMTCASCVAYIEKNVQKLEGMCA